MKSEVGLYGRVCMVRLGRKKRRSTYDEKSILLFAKLEANIGIWNAFFGVHGQRLEAVFIHYGGDVDGFCFVFGHGSISLFIQFSLSF